MSAEHPNLVSLFEAALEIEHAPRRSAFLDESCGTEVELRKLVEQLLEANERAIRIRKNQTRDVDVTRVQDASGNELTEALDAGQLTAIAGEEAVGLGGNFSVLRSLGQMVDRVPHVVLRDAPAAGDDSSPPSDSPEFPARDADSRYELQGEIARGGMGAILKGRDNDLGRDLAIKVLLDSHKRTPEVIQRFIEEAQIGGQLQHPGIAPIYELGQFADHRPFFSMKLVKGKTLSALLAKRVTPAEDRGKLLGIFEQICQTMAYAHSRNVIHRDLKPANIMVGAFGEVQVMDWGLAKVLSQGGATDEKPPREKQQPQSVIQTRRSAGSDSSSGSFGSAGSETQMGRVMGTPAYMPPEQALGEVDQLDQRSDVFGLGAILAEILTGQPPYVGDDGTQIYRLASRGKLDDCFARLDACEADGQLIELTKQCLAAEPEQRPADGGVLAGRVTGYLESVESKLREAEMERAAQAARAKEERKRQRVTLALAAAILLLLCLGGGGWVWTQQQAAERRAVATAKVNGVLNEARLHQRLADATNADDEAGLNLQVQELESALASARDAVELSDQEDVGSSLRQTAEHLAADLKQRTETVQQRAAQAAADRAFQEDLDLIRLSQAGVDSDVLKDLHESEESGDGGLQHHDAGAFDLAAAASLYKRAFNKAGLDVLTLDPSAARIKSPAMRESLIAALDIWARGLPDSATNSPTTRPATPRISRAKLLALANAVDSNEWRKQLRAALAASDMKQLNELAANDEVRKQSPTLIAWLGAALREANQTQISVDVLRSAQKRYPGNFWLNFELGQSLRKTDDQVEGLGFTRAALASHPRSVGAWLQLAAALRDLARYDESIGACRRAIELDPLNAVAHRNLGSVLRNQGKLDEAIDEYRIAIEIDPNYATAHHSIGMTLELQDKLPEAVDEYRRAVELDPHSATILRHLGDALREQGKDDEAIVAFRQAIDLEPKFANAHIAGWAAC